MASTPPTLAFIDTNIILDFYRVRGDDSRLDILKRLDANHDRIITTYQVEMEFKKNRQIEILKSWKGLKMPNWSESQVPSFLRQAQPARMIAKHQSAIKAQIQRARGRISKVLQEPKRTDPVYRSFQRLFRSRTEYNLRQDDKICHTIQRLARKRFFLGFPPRKAGDTSCGDAVNWEWIISCAKRAKKDIVIISRDSDYGASYEKESIINDWLSQEFKERVGRSRSVTLTNRLAQGFKIAEIEVSEKEEEEDRRQLEEIMQEARSRAGNLSAILYGLDPQVSTLSSQLGESMRQAIEVIGIGDEVIGIGDEVMGAPTFIGSQLEELAGQIAVTSGISDLSQLQREIAERVTEPMRQLIEQQKQVFEAAAVIQGLLPGVTGSREDDEEDE